MILVDTSVWIDHLQRPDEALIALLRNDDVLGHPFVIGELAVGNLRERTSVLALLQSLPQLTVAPDDEVWRFIETHNLFGVGLGYVDVHLLVAMQLYAGTLLWTYDKRLQAACERLGLAAHRIH